MKLYLVGHKSYSVLTNIIYVYNSIYHIIVAVIVFPIIKLHYLVIISSFWYINCYCFISIKRSFQILSIFVFRMDVLANFLSWYTKDILAIIRQVGIQGSDRIIDGFKIYLSGCLTINSIFPQTRLLILQNIFPLYKDHNMTPLYHLLLDLLFKDMNENLELRINIKNSGYRHIF